MSENNILGVILAGGKSKRFGDDKTAAKLGSKTLLDHTIEKIEKKFQEILIIANNEIIFDKKNVFLTKDLIDGHLGPLIGVLSAMEWIKRNKKNYNWIATFPCDTPFFDENLIEKIKNCPNNSSKRLFFKTLNVVDLAFPISEYTLYIIIIILYSTLYRNIDIIINTTNQIS